MKQVLLGKIAPNPERIAAALAALSIQRLDAVLVGHSHYDHALDAPVVARQTDALLVGSPSTAQIGRGMGLSESQIRIIQPGQSLLVRDLEITFYQSMHSLPLLYPGAIEHPLVPPARASAYREGGTFTILITSQTGSILVQESANLIPGGLAGLRAGTVFLSIAQLGHRSKKFIRQYFRETVLAVGARKVIPIHWDNFQKPSREGLKTLPFWMDDIPRAMRVVQGLCLENQVQFQIPEYGKTLEIPA
jgi:L-ascorbate metabolism protein UlaG (beta-lactamase superfamily)